KQQCTAANNGCGYGPSYQGAWPLPGHAFDLPTIYATLAMGCYGTLNVALRLTPEVGSVQAGLPAPQTATFDVEITNTGYSNNTYTLTLGGSWPGVTLAAAPST